MARLSLVKDSGWLSKWFSNWIANHCQKLLSTHRLKSSRNTVRLKSVLTSQFTRLDWRRTKLCSKWMDQPSSTQMRQASQCPSLKIKSWSAYKLNQTVHHPQSRLSALPSSRTLGIKSPWIRPCSVNTLVGVTTNHRHCTQSARSRTSQGSRSRGLSTNRQCLRLKTLKCFKMPCRRQTKLAKILPKSPCHRLIRKKKMKLLYRLSFRKHWSSTLFKRSTNFTSKKNKKRWKRNKRNLKNQSQSCRSCLKMQSFAK